MDDSKKPTSCDPRPSSAANPEGNWKDDRGDTITRSGWGLWTTYYDTEAGFLPSPTLERTDQGLYSKIHDLKMKDGTVITTRDESWSTRSLRILKAMQEELLGHIRDESLRPKIKRQSADALSEAFPARRNGDCPNYRHTTTRHARGCAKQQEIAVKCGLPMWFRLLSCLSKSNTGTRTRLPGHKTPHSAPAASSPDPGIMAQVLVPSVPAPCLPPIPSRLRSLARRYPRVRGSLTRPAPPVHTARPAIPIFAL